MGALLRQALTLTRLRSAYARVLENHGQPGVDGVDVESFGNKLDENLRGLRSEVSGNRYHPLPLKRLWLPRAGGTARPIAIPAVRDRVLQTAVAQTITPLLEAEFEDCSFAYRRGRSVRMAVERIGLLQRQGYRWVVEADIEKFFDRIPHNRLLSELRTVVRDDALVSLVQLWLTAPIEDDGQLSSVSLGVPQGSPISPLLSNLYLDHVDEMLLGQGLALVRYADDFVILTKNRDKAEAAVELTSEVLRDLELKLNPLKTRVVNFDTGFRFLGWNFVKSLAVPAGRHDEEVRTSPRPPTTSPEKEAVKSPPESPGDEPTVSGSSMVEAYAEALEDNPRWRSSDDSSDKGRKEAVVDSKDPPSPVNTIESTDDSQDESAAPLPPPSLQRTLYLVDPATRLATVNRHLVVKRDETVLLDLPAVNVDQVMLFGYNTLTTPAMICCLRHDIPIAFLSKMGKFYGRLEPPSSASINLLTAQFACHAAQHLDLELARAFVLGKLRNSALVLSRYARHRQTNDDTHVHEAINLLRRLARRTRGSLDLDTLRGLEGAGAAAYFDVWRRWLSPGWTFGARQARHGADPINALLDLGYSLLHQCVAGLIQARGLNPWLGHLHRPKPGHMALASDLMETFRPIIVDSVVLNACLNNRLGTEDFVSRDGAWFLRPEAARGFIRDFETRFNTERQHPQSSEKLDLRRIIDAQIRSLATAYRQKDACAFSACIFR